LTDTIEFRARRVFYLLVFAHARGASARYASCSALNGN
jgi:hypothetical protein